MKNSTGRKIKKEKFFDDFFLPPDFEPVLRRSRPSKVHKVGYQKPKVDATSVSPSVQKRSRRSPSPDDDEDVDEDEEFEPTKRRRAKTLQPPSFFSLLHSRLLATKVRNGQGTEEDRKISLEEIIEMVQNLQKDEQENGETTKSTKLTEQEVLEAMKNSFSKRGVPFDADIRDFILVTQSNGVPQARRLSEICSVEGKCDLVDSEWGIQDQSDTSCFPEWFNFLMPSSSPWTEPTLSDCKGEKTKSIPSSNAQNHRSSKHHVENQALQNRSKARASMQHPDYSSRRREERSQICDQTSQEFVSHPTKPDTQPALIYADESLPIFTYEEMLEYCRESQERDDNDMEFLDLASNDELMPFFCDNEHYGNTLKRFCSLGTMSQLTDEKASTELETDKKKSFQCGTRKSSGFWRGVSSALGLQGEGEACEQPVSRISDCSANPPPKECEKPKETVKTEEKEKVCVDGEDFGCNTPNWCSVKEGAKNAVTDMKDALSASKNTTQNFLSSIGEAIKLDEKPPCTDDDAKQKEGCVEPTEGEKNKNKENTCDPCPPGGDASKGKENKEQEKKEVKHQEATSEEDPCCIAEKAEKGPEKVKKGETSADDQPVAEKKHADEKPVESGKKEGAFWCVPSAKTPPEKKSDPGEQQKKSEGSTENSAVLEKPEKCLEETEITIDISDHKNVDSSEKHGNQTTHSYF